MNNALLMRVLDSLADLDKKGEPFPHGKSVLVTEITDAYPHYNLHHKERAPRVRGSGIEDSGNILMIHQSQRMPLLFKPCNDLPRVHPQLHDLESNLPVERRRLLRQVNNPASP